MQVLSVRHKTNRWKATKQCRFFFANRKYRFLLVNWSKNWFLLVNWRKNWFFLVYQRKLKPRWQLDTNRQAWPTSSIQRNQILNRRFLALPVPLPAGFLSIHIDLCKHFRNGAGQNTIQDWDKVKPSKTETLTCHSKVPHVKVLVCLGIQDEPPNVIPAKVPQRPPGVQVCRQKQRAVLEACTWTLCPFWHGSWMREHWAQL